MSKKLQITVSDDLYQWLKEESEYRGTKVSSLVTFLLGESRRNDLTRNNMYMMMQRINSLTSDQFVTLMTKDNKRPVMDNIITPFADEFDGQEDSITNE